MNNDNNANSSNKNNNQNNVNNTPVSSGPIKEAQVVDKKEPTPEERNRNVMRIIGAILAIIVILAVFGILPGKKSATKDSKVDAPYADLPEGCEPGYLFSETTGKPCPQPGDDENVSDKDSDIKAKNTNDKSSKAAVSLSNVSSSYDKALGDYSGKLITFDAACNASSATVSVDAGTRVLVANNSKETKTISVANLREETLDPYHYFTVALKEKGDIKVSCEGKESATFNVK